MRFEMGQVSIAEICASFSYDKDSGVVSWKLRDGRMRRAGSRRSDGYLQIKLGPRRLMAHRVAWAIAYGEWPNGEIDHANGARDDNRLSNLRVCCRAENAQNRARMKNNSTGQTGVHYFADRRQYIARIAVRGRRIFLGSFNSLGEASVAYTDAKARLHEFAPSERGAN